MTKIFYLSRVGGWENFFSEMLLLPWSQDEARNKRAAQMPQIFFLLTGKRGASESKDDFLVMFIKRRYKSGSSLRLKLAIPTKVRNSYLCTSLKKTS